MVEASPPGCREAFSIDKCQRHVSEGDPARGVFETQLVIRLKFWKMNCRAGHGEIVEWSGLFIVALPQATRFIYSGVAANHSAT